MLTLLVGILALKSAACGGSAAPGIMAISYGVTRLSNRVVVLDCQSVNVTAIATDSGIVVIDTNRSRGIMEHLRGVIEQEFGRKDFAYVINTHGDPDHSSGNWAFPSVPLIAHRNSPAFLLHAKASTLHNEWSLRRSLQTAHAGCRAVKLDSSEEAELLARITALESMYADARDGRTARMPTIVFSDTLSLDLGNLTLELRFCGEAHTNHDLVLYVPEEKLLVTGDLISSPRSAGFSINAMADVPRLLRELEGLLQRQPGIETVVPGHGKTLTRADMLTFCGSLAERFRRVRTEDSAALLVGRTIEREGIHVALDRFPVSIADVHGSLYWSEEEFGTLGLRLMRSGMLEEAMRVLQRAIDALPQSAFLNDCLGDVCVEREDRAAAVAAYEQSLALMPENRHAREMLSILR
jgi:glyoxylase-like metal-dependent hydrolase (beta-lactamase superfamily II)